MSTINNFTGDRNGTLVAFVEKDFHNIEKITCENLGNYANSAPYIKRSKERAALSSANFMMFLGSHLTGGVMRLQKQSKFC